MLEAKYKAASLPTRGPRGRQNRWRALSCPLSAVRSQNKKRILIETFNVFANGRSLKVLQGPPPCSACVGDENVETGSDWDLETLGSADGGACFTLPCALCGTETKCSQGSSRLRYLALPSEGFLSVLPAVPFSYRAYSPRTSHSCDCGTAGEKSSWAAVDNLSV